jgi:hypothetical protein
MQGPVDDVVVVWMGYVYEMDHMSFFILSPTSFLTTSSFHANRRIGTYYFLTHQEDDGDDHLPRLLAQ